MTIVDTGPLVAIIVSDQKDHKACVQILRSLPKPLVTTWPVLTEAMHLLGRIGGWTAQEALWRLVNRQTLEIIVPDSNSLLRMYKVMQKYQDRPMDLADSSLVILAEDVNQKVIFTLDSDFDFYRLHGKQNFEIVP
jgi:predicted nucleic acid-binding protein